MGSRPSPLSVRLIATLLVVTTTVTQTAPLWAEPLSLQDDDKPRGGFVSLAQAQTEMAAEQADLAQRRTVVALLEAPPANPVSVLPDATLRRLLQQAEEEYRDEEDAAVPGTRRALQVPGTGSADPSTGWVPPSLTPAGTSSVPPTSAPGTGPTPSSAGASPASSGATTPPPSSGGSSTPQSAGRTSSTPPVGTPPGSPTASIVPPGGQPPTQPPPAAPLAPPHLQIERLSTEVQLTIYGVPGSTFRIDGAETVTGPWVSLGSGTIDASGTAQFIDRRPTADRQFYRVEALPAPTQVPDPPAPTLAGVPETLAPVVDDKPLEIPWTASKPVTLAWTVTRPDASTVRGTATGTKGTLTFGRTELPTDGTYTLTVTATDTVGHPLAAPLVRALTVDRERWRMGRGTHGFLVQGTDGKWTRRPPVTRTGTLPALRDPQALPDGPRVTQTTADRQVSTYINGQLMMAERPDGSKIVRPTLDAKGQITGGWLTTPDNALTYLENGAAVWRREANNGPVTWFFPDGRPEAAQTQGIQQVVSTGTPSPDVAYAYLLEKGPDGKTEQVTKTLVTTPEMSTLYDLQGRPLVQLHATGRRLTYQNGRPALVESAGQSSMAYAERTENGRIIVEPKDTAKIPEPFRDLPRRLVYASDGATLLEATQGDGTRLEFLGAGQVRVTDPQGVVTQTQTGAAGVTVTRQGITRQYDATGALAQLALPGQGGNAGMTLQGEAVKVIRLPAFSLPDKTAVPEGTMITDPNGGVVDKTFFDNDNHLIKGLVTFPDGRTVRYVDRQPLEGHLSDGSTIAYTNGQPSRLTMANGLRYTIAHGSHRPDATAPHWVATLEGAPSVSDSELLPQIVFSDPEWKLQEATRQGGAVLRYENGRLATLTQPDGVLVEYRYDQIGRLRETVTKSLDKVTRRYLGNALFSATDADGAMTTYDYTTDPRGWSSPAALLPDPTTVSAESRMLARTTVTYQGKVRGVFTYRYDRTTTPDASVLRTHVTDDSGTTRTYDALGNLVGIEQADGTRYAVTSARDLSAAQRAALAASPVTTVRYKDVNGQEQTLAIPSPDAQLFRAPTGDVVTIQSLTRRVLPDGTTLQYADGRLEQIRWSNGRTLDQFTLDRNGIPLRGRLTLPGGQGKSLQNGGLVEVTQANGVKLRYQNDVLAEIHVPMNAVRDVTLSRLGLDGSGHVNSGEVLLPSEDRLVLRGGQFVAARLADGTEVQSVTVKQDVVTGATLAVNGSNATLSETKTVAVTLPSGQQYQYDYTDPAGNPTTTVAKMTFRDDFKDGNYDGWRIAQSNQLRDWRVEDNAFIGEELNRGDGTPHIIAATGMNWQNYTATAQFTYERKLEDKSSEAQLLFRWVDPQNFYRIILMKYGGWRLTFTAMVSGSQTEQHFQLPQGYDPGNSRHALQVEAKGPTFRFFLDGALIGQASNDRITRGSVGFGVRTAIVKFHEIDVQFSGDDSRDSATRGVDDKLRALRSVVAEAQGFVNQIGVVPAALDPVADGSRAVQLTESTDPDVQAAVEAVRAAASDPSLPVIAELDAKGQPLAIQRIDGAVSVYEHGRPTQLLTAAGELQAQYAYDAGGELVNVTLVSARRRLGDQLAVLRQEVREAQTKELTDMARRVGVGQQQFEKDAGAARETLVNAEKNLQGKLQELTGMAVEGKEAKKQKSGLLDEMRQGLNNLRDARAKFEQGYAEKLATLHKDVAKRQGEIDDGTKTALKGLDEQEAVVIKSFLRQELTPRLVTAFREKVGRDPSQAEIEDYVKEIYALAGSDPRAIPSTEAIKARIEQLLKSEIDARTKQVEAIKAQVSAWLKDDYIPVSAARQAELVRSLGIPPEEIVPLTGADATKILGWLTSRSLHFGHSAFLALQEYLAAQGKKSDDLITLARDAILIDILVGAINPKTTGDLQLSLFALQTVAAKQGAPAVSSKILFDTLKTFIAQPLTVVGTIPREYSRALAVSSDGRWGYVAQQVGGNDRAIVKLDLATNQPVGSPLILGVQQNTYAGGLVLSQDGKTLYVGMMVTGYDPVVQGVFVVDTETFQQKAVLDGRGPAGTGQAFYSVGGMTMTPDGRTLLVGDGQGQSTSRVAVIDMTTNALKGWIDGLDNVNTLVVQPKKALTDPTTLYVGSESSGTLTIVDFDHVRLSPPNAKPSRRQASLPAPERGSDDDVVITPLGDGARQVTWGDGVRLMQAPDGTATLINPDGVTGLSRDADGTLHLTYLDNASGEKTFLAEFVRHPDGTTEMVRRGPPDPARVYTWAFTIQPDAVPGLLRFYGATELVGTLSPDGTVSWGAFRFLPRAPDVGRMGFVVRPDGTITMSHPDRSTTRLTPGEAPDWTAPISLDEAAPQGTLQRKSLLPRDPAITTLTNQPFLARTLAFHPNGQDLYIVEHGRAILHVFDTTTRQVKGRVLLEKAPKISTGLQTVSFSVDGTKAYVTTAYTGELIVVDTATLTVVQRMTLAANQLMTGSVFDPARQRLYVVHNSKPGGIFQIALAAPVIAHVKGNHYVLVQSIAADGTVTYREPNAGPMGQTLTMTRAEFEQIWKGVVLAARAPPQPQQALSAREAQQVRGAGGPLWWFAFGLVLGLFHDQIAAILHSMAVWVNDYLKNTFPLLAPTLNTLATFLRGDFKEGIKQYGKLMLQAVIETAAVAVAFLIGGPLGVIAYGISRATSGALLDAGVDPKVANAVGTVVGAGFTGGLNGVIQAVVLVGVQVGLTAAGMDPTLAQITAIAAAVAVNAFTNGTKTPVAYDRVTHAPLPESAVAPWRTVPPGFEALGIALKTQIAPTVTAELASYGVQKLGESAGLDPRITAAIGAPIKAGVGALASETRSTQTVTQSFSGGLLKSAGTLAVQYGAEALKLDPIAGALTTTALNAAIQTTLNGGKVFEGVRTAFTKAVQGALTTGGSVGGTAVAQAEQLAKLHDFTTLISDPKIGLAGAVELYATSLLQRTSIEAMVNTFGSVGNAIKTKLPTAPDASLDGKAVKAVSFGPDTVLYVDKGTQNLVGLKEGTTLTHYEEIKVDPATRTAGMTKGTIEQVPLTGTQVQARILQEISKGDIQSVTIQDGAGTAYTITPENAQRLRLNANGTIKDGVLTETRTNTTYHFQDSQLKTYDARRDLWGKDAQGQITVQPGAVTVHTKLDAQGHIAAQEFRLPDGQRLTLSNASGIVQEVKASGVFLTDTTGKLVLWTDGQRVATDGMSAVVGLLDKVKAGEIPLDANWTPEQVKQRFLDLLPVGTGPEQRSKEVFTAEANTAFKAFDVQKLANALSAATVKQYLVDSPWLTSTLPSGVTVKQRSGFGVVWSRSQDGVYTLEFSPIFGVSTTNTDRGQVFKTNALGGTIQDFTQFHRKTVGETPFSIEKGAEAAFTKTIDQKALNLRYAVAAETAPGAVPQGKVRINVTAQATGDKTFSNSATQFEYTEPSDPLRAQGEMVYTLETIRKLFVSRDVPTGAVLPVSLSAAQQVFQLPEAKGLVSTAAQQQIIQDLVTTQADNLKAKVEWKP